MSTDDNNIACAACGKEGDGDTMNTCNKCKMVKYCNAACKKKHKSKHKKQCERRAAELHDGALFKDPPPPEDCPICCLPLPGTEETMFRACCGKVICDGCCFAAMEGDCERGKKQEDIGLCPFCRMPPVHLDEEEVARVKKVMERGNADAYSQENTDQIGPNWTGSGGMPNARADVFAKLTLCQPMQRLY